MRFQFEKDDRGSGLRTIDISTKVRGEFFQIEIRKESSGKILMGCLFHGCQPQPENITINVYKSEEKHDD